MVSFGMLLDFAFAITSRNLLLLEGSELPPSFTATAISLPIFVKIFPFAASFFSFLCLILANSRFFDTIDEVPKEAYTMGIKAIMQAKKIVVVVSGEGKAEIAKKAFFGPVTPKVPASVLQLHNDVTVIMCK